MPLNLSLNKRNGPTQAKQILSPLHFHCSFTIIKSFYFHFIDRGDGITFLLWPKHSAFYFIVEHVSCILSVHFRLSRPSLFVYTNGFLAMKRISFQNDLQPVLACEKPQYSRKHDSRCRCIKCNTHVWDVVQCTGPLGDLYKMGLFEAYSSRALHLKCKMCYSRII